MKKVSFMIGVVIFLISMGSQAFALNVEDLLRLKRAGVSDETLQLFIQLELEKVHAQTVGPGRTMGQRTVEGPDGKKRVIRYSIEDPDQVINERLERKELERRSWEMLRDLVIDARNCERGEE